MSSGRLLGGLLIGGALGVIVGLLIAPRRGDETRDMIRDEVSGRWNRSLDEAREKALEIQEKARDTADRLCDKGKHLAEDLKETGMEQWERLRSTVTVASKDNIEKS